MVELNVCNVMPGKYMIDEDGNVFSRYINKYLSQSLNKDGYYKVNLRDINHKNMSILVHKLVALTFIGEPPTNMPDPTVDHVDGNNKNNNINNLRWLNRPENSSLKHTSVKGENNGRNKLSKENINQIVHMFKENISGRKIAMLFNVDPKTISDIKNGKIWGWYTEALFNE